MDFERFYAVYPRKIARLDAERAWNQMSRKYDPERIIEGAEKFAREVAAEGTEQCFVPYPASWLRAGRWMDQEHETIKPEAIMRPARSAEEMRQYLRDVDKPISAEIERAKTVADLPVFARMIPTAWKQQLRVVSK